VANRDESSRGRAPPTGRCASSPSGPLVSIAANSAAVVVLAEWSPVGRDPGRGYHPQPGEGRGLDNRHQAPEASSRQADAGKF
jgi:hypothetical protein